MNQKRSNYLKALPPPAPRTFWASNGGPLWVKPKGNYDAGRNASKRKDRRADIRARAAARRA